MNPGSNRFVFIAGLHRTGTSLLSRIIASHPEVSAIENAPVPENEGCYLQGAIPHTALHGRPGRYAIDPRERHEEDSCYNCLETRQRLMADWAPWFDEDKPWWLEKSPVNLTRMRLYQQLFPTSQFIVILRHPQMMAAALAKWVDDDPGALVNYALDAYEDVAKDCEYLHSILLLRYEDLVAEPDAVRRACYSFLSLDDEGEALPVRDGNSDYDVSETLACEATSRMRHWGYLPGGKAIASEPLCRHPLRAVRERTLAALQSLEAGNRASAYEKEQEANIRQ